MSVQVVRFPDLGQALEQIRKEHQPNQWLYRGQTHRRETHRLAVDDQRIELENLYPGSFRFATGYPSLSKAFDEEWRKNHVRSENLFDAFFLFLGLEYERADANDSPRFTWMDPYVRELRELFQSKGRSLFGEYHRKRVGIRDPEFVRVCWALAQHYGIITSLLDFTFDPDVAAWFATNEWSSPEKSLHLEGEGVIYRIGLAQLHAAIYTFNRVFRSPLPEESFLPPPDNLFVHDLRHIPPSFALRPMRQHAAVVRGFDDFRFLRMIFNTDTVSAFLFDQIANTGSRRPLSVTREELIPLIDPFEDLQKTFEKSLSKLGDETERLFSYTKPLAVITENGVKLASPGPDPSGLDREVSEAGYIEANRLLESGHPEKAAQGFERVLAMARQQSDDRMVSYAHLGLGAALASDGNLTAFANEIAEALEGVDRVADAAWASEVFGSAVEGAAQLADKGRCSEARLLLEKVLALAVRTKMTVSGEDATVRALYLAGVIEIQEHNSDAGLMRLQQVVERSGEGHTGYQRMFVAAAYSQMAKWHEVRAEREQANDLYRQIISRFAHDESPEVRRFVDSAQRQIDITMKHNR